MLKRRTGTQPIHIVWTTTQEVTPALDRIASLGGPLDAAQPNLVSLGIDEVGRIES